MLCERLGHIYGFEKAGNRIRGIVESVLKSMKKNNIIELTESENFVLLKGTGDVSPRGLCKDGDLRNIECISLGELQSGIKEILKTEGAIPKNSLIKSAGNAFGFQRIGPLVEKRIGLAVEKLLNNKIISELEEKITLIM